MEDSGVDVGLVLNYMDDAQNGLNIVILDACRNNPFSRSFRSASEGLAQVDAPTGTLIAYATAPGRVAADGVGENGLYTSELLKQMRVPGLSATDMFMQVRAEVMKRTGNKQVPWEASSLVGVFYFSAPAAKPAGTETAAAPSETKFDSAAFEFSYWETIRSSSSADDYKAYLAKYPDGQFATLAKNRIKSLEVVSKPVEQSPTSVNSGAAEIAFWDSVKHSTNPDDFRLYLKNYPEGAFADLATSRVNSLEAASERAKREVFRGFRVNIGYRNKDGVNRLDVANKIAERLRSLGAEVGVYENNWKNWNGKLFFSSSSDAQTANKIAESIADLVTATPIPAPDKSVKDKQFSLWLQ